MDRAQTWFSLDALGVALAGEGPRDAQGDLVRGREYPGNDYIEYILPRESLGAGLPPTEHAMYRRGLEIEACEGTEVLADVVASYFDRTYKHFCSHRQTPSSGRVVHPGAVQKGQVIYFCHPIFSQYQARAPRWCKQLFLNALQRLLPDPLVRVVAPSATIVALNSQAQENRWVLHLLYYVPERRCEQYDVIEDVVPVYDVEVSVRTGVPVAGVSCVPQGEALPFSEREGLVTFTVPRLDGHQMVEIAFM
jgi:hypothetical protein